MSTYEELVADLGRDYRRAGPKDALQFCANWFQARLEEQRTRTRDTLTQRQRPSFSHELPAAHYIDPSADVPTTVSPFSQSIPRSSLRNSSPSPFGTLDVPGNALLSGPNDAPAAPFQFNNNTQVAPTAPNPFAGFDGSVSPFSISPPNPGDYLHPPSSMIFARRTSVSAESIAVDSGPDEPLPVFPKSADQVRRIKASIASNFIFRDLDEEQETGVLNAMQEMRVGKDEVVIRQGDVGEYFYVVEEGLLHCYIRPDPLPPAWFSETPGAREKTPKAKFLQPGYHPQYGKKVAECKTGNSFGELALMYGHPRAATVLSIEPSTLWSLDRITFRTIILKAAHRRRTMYEQFLVTVPLLTSLEPEERSKIADALVSKVYNDGEAVVSQGEMGDTFFFVEEGNAVVTKEHEEGGALRMIEVGNLKKGDYFGELSLLRLAPRAATVSAARRSDPSRPKLKVAGLDAHAFTRLLGPLREIMERKAGESYGPGYKLR